ncbi:MAG: ACP S-malonyltransferase, partial [Polyangiaceae bacterium]
PGQGSQSVGMIGEVLAGSPAARSVMARADSAMNAASPGSPVLSRLILEGPLGELTLTANAQPAILAASCAVLAAIRERVPGLGIPAFVAGHSLGEYSALVAAEALSLEDALSLVRARGLAMQDAVPEGIGAMCAVIGLEQTRVEALCEEVSGGEIIAPANFNAPGQIVVAGHAGAVTRLAQRVVADKGRAIPLKVSAPFHCALMKPAARAVEARLSLIDLRAPIVPVVANFDARPNRDVDRVRELLVRQIDGAVRWDESVRLMADRGVTHALEIGPGKVLGGLVKRIAKDLRVLSVGDAASLDLVPAFLAEAEG